MRRKRLRLCPSADCRDVLLPLVTDQLSGQLDDHSSKPDHEACAQLLSTVLDILDRKDVVRLLLSNSRVSGLQTSFNVGQRKRRIKFQPGPGF